VLDGTTLVLSGAGGSLGGLYYVVASTNLAERMTNWQHIATNRFNADGTFAVTNSLERVESTKFFRLEIP